MPYQKNVALSCHGHNNILLVTTASQKLTRMLPLEITPWSSESQTYLTTAADEQIKACVVKRENQVIGIE